MSLLGALCGACAGQKIEPQVASEDREMLEDLVAAAVNDAVNKVEQQTQARMSSVMSGVALPPGFKLPF